MCRLLWAVQYFVGAGFYVIPTYSPADHSVDNLVTSTPALFLRNWANLWTAITEVTSPSCIRSTCPLNKRLRQIRHSVCTMTGS